MLGATTLSVGFRARSEAMWAKMGEEREESSVVKKTTPIWSDFRLGSELKNKLTQLYNDQNKM